MIIPVLRKLLPEEIKEKYHHWQEYKYHQNLRKTPGNTYKRFDETRSIFIHIPKAGGISIIKSLYGDQAEGIGHRTYKHFKWIFGEENYNDYFKFTFVRNPFDRLLSAYSFLKKGGMNAMDKEFGETTLKPYDTFEKFVMQWLTPENADSWVHFIPQYKYLYDENKNLMVNFVGRFENFNEDYEKIRHKIGTGEKLKHLNKSKDKKGENYRDIYTPQMIEKVVSVYKQDLKLFDYSF
ncbi:sulfotransferase family 2 domain-containing protein [Hydrogenimonas cancrithermarum]|uniref:Sulfotransferase family protein n=1 Tax=Hydrogenimonas cancrithermarum TaxID=2993563 RepID=A0ABN6WZ29_9BACT|nr:sulfotransferase family 2 domain-containing protein [Hydrogenimonas cancrithermarum]BDY13547.1 hypothetical protein HCR_18590 [Hydrogenimonas cancrithermarum]